eukprot:TRINITY_DN1349_c0_g1_i1.p3 TRINITY_DN1349_c0_g1~~TRINITY_DN1349_c0_g1_i1.p3  ORF type:complete len:106 (+),score=37.97 TRINITY_DN1349_c0_g1_i1:436-753(+)
MSHMTRKIAGKIEKHFDASSLTIVIQDGPEAGQTVPHVHCHIIPRKKGDFENNDDIYDEVDRVDKVDRDDPKYPRRTEDDMAQEATELASLFDEEDEDELECITD